MSETSQSSRISLWMTILLVIACVLPIGILVYYMSQRSLNYPVFDELLARLPIAVKVAEGDFQISDVFQLYGGAHHRLVFTLTSAAIMTAACQWCIELESYLTILWVLGIIGLLLHLLRRYNREQIPVLLIPLMWLMFSPRQSVVWIVPAYNVRIQETFFFVLAFACLNADNITLRRFLLALIFTICATYTMSAGMVVWVLLLLWLFLKAKRLTPYIILWVVFAVANIALYMYDIPAEAYQEAIHYTLVDFIRFGFMLLGAPFALAGQHIRAEFIGILGAIMFAINVYVLWRRKQVTVLYVPLMLTLFALANAFITTVGRLQRGLYAALREWYVPPTSLFWIALLCLMIAVIMEVVKSKSAKRFRLVIYANMGLLVIITVAFGFMLGEQLRKELTFDDTVEDCLTDYPLTMNAYCTWMINWFPQDMPAMLRQTVRHNLGLYANPLYDMPSAYRTDSPVIMDTADAIRDEVLRHTYVTDLSSDRIWNTSVAPDEPPPNFRDAIQDSSQVWRVHMDTQAVPSVQLPEIPGYAYALLADELIRDEHHVMITGYQLFELAADEHIQFGDSMQVFDWWLADATPIAPGDVLSVYSIWGTSEAIELNYSMSMMLYDNNGNRVAATDATFTFPSHTWQPNHYYIDQREIMLPSDLPAGQYTLGLVVYYYTNPGEPLLITGQDTGFLELGVIQVQ